MKFFLYANRDRRDTALTTRSKKKKHQEGLTMMLSLGFLLMIALIGGAAVTEMTLNSKVVSSTKNRYISFNTAESALLSNALLFQNPDIPPECNPNATGLLNEKKTGVWWDSFDWGSHGKQKQFNAVPMSHTVIEPPVIGASPYSFDSISHDTDVFYNYYRVTSRGKGVSSSVSYVQGSFIMKQHRNKAC
jgi:hypothetical protein